ncbi:MAG: hypothetical protein KC586_30295, partial [Myxococcales bacterium]|nr:hypothetical protein [Myxococcales bacterium]
MLDGPIEGGKTASVAAVVRALDLLRRSTSLGPAYVWEDIPGGHTDECLVRCEIFGDAPLDAGSRRRVLESADAVIFVADSHPLLVEDNRHFLEGTRAALGPSDPCAPVGLLVLANKQDRPRAVPPPVLALRLGIGTGTPVVGAVATEGETVLPAFRFAVNAAVSRLRHLLIRGVEIPVVDAGESDLTASGPALESVPGGAAWPKETARQILERACAGSFRAARRPRVWMFPDATELRSTTGLLLHSRPAWRLPSLQDARVELARQVRSWLPWRDVLPEERCAMVAADADGWRVWVIS